MQEPDNIVDALIDGRQPTQEYNRRKKLIHSFMQLLPSVVLMNHFGVVCVCVCVRAGGEGERGGA